MSEDGVETLEAEDCIGGLGASRFLRLGCRSALWLVFGVLGVLGVLGAGGLAEDGLREAEADLSAPPLRLDSFEVAGGEGGIKLGGGAFSPAILPSEINFRKLLKSSFSSLPGAAVAAAATTGGGATTGITGGGGGGGGGSISSVALLAATELLLRRGLFLTGLGLRLVTLLLLVDLTSILCTKLVGETPVAEGAPSGGTRSPWGPDPESSMSSSSSSPSVWSFSSTEGKSVLLDFRSPGDPPLLLSRSPAPGW